MPKTSYHVNQAFDPDGAGGDAGDTNGIGEVRVRKITADNGSSGKEVATPTPAGGSPTGADIGKTRYELDDHRIPLAQLCARYSTDVAKGLKSAQVDKNRVKYGANILIPPKKPSLVWEFFKCVFGGLNSLLWACAVLSLGSYFAQYAFPQPIAPDNLLLACALVVVVHVSGAFAFYQQFKSDRIMESFKNMVPHFAHVVRDGRKTEVAVSDLVVGDIVDIKYGDLIPADVRILECSSFKVDNSSLTGESEPQKRLPDCTDNNPMETKNLAFFSTNALEGHAKGMVVKTGPNTVMGRLASLTSTVDSGDSPIKKEMNRFIIIMVIRSLLFGGTFFIVALLMNYSWINAIFFVVGIVVANVPEGLTVTFTMVLALTAKRMANKYCLVKNIQSVETLGSTSVICSDKTGTLTQNKMSVSHLWFNNDIGEADTSEYTRTRTRFFATDASNGFVELANVACLCSKATFHPEDDALPVRKRRVNGDPSESAILKYMEENFGNVIQYREARPKLMEIPFNSRNKFQLSIHDVRDPADPRHLVVVKGAPERIANMCSEILIGNRTHKFDHHWRQEFNDIYMQLGTLGERVFGFCDLRLPIDKYPVGTVFDSESTEFMELQYRFVGLMSMIDPPRPTVPDAVVKCRSAGVKVVMVTGDHPVTATAIARSVHILSEGNKTIEEVAMERCCSVEEVDPTEIKAAVVTGMELDLLTPEQLRNVILNHEEIVFARTSPEQKFMIVDAFQDLGFIVACTGDGVNDSPALKKADIGIAMGIVGTEVSKETADMILMDDNFATIVTGIEEGRLIFDNIKKLICYNLSDNIAEMYSVWVFIILACPLPMGTIAMLLSVLGTDVFPAISIAHEKAEADIMKLKPRNPHVDKLVTPQLLSYTYGQTSVIELCSGFFTYFVTMGYNGFLPQELYGIGTYWTDSAINDLKDSYGQEWSYAARTQLALTAQTAFFASIVLTQVANVVICKTRRLSLFQKGMGNWLMNLAIVFEIGLMALLIYTPVLNSALNLAPLGWESFIPPIPFMILLIVYDELRRLGIRLTGKDSWVHSEFYT